MSIKVIRGVQEGSVCSAAIWRLTLAVLVVAALIVSLGITTAKAANLQPGISTELSLQYRLDCESAESDASSAHHHGICVCYANIVPSNTGMFQTLVQVIVHYENLSSLPVSRKIAPLLRPPLA